MGDGMLDVHAPHEKIHGFKDFMLHLLTITIGLLIALGLEAGVEAMHHRHQREQAEATIRQELSDNRATLVKQQESVHAEIQSLVRVLQYLEARSKGQPADAKGLSLAVTEMLLKDAAWRTARATAVLNYVDYGHVERYAAAYKEQEEFEAIGRQTLDRFLQLDSYIVKDNDPNQMSAEDVRAAIPDVRSALVHLGAMRDVSRGTLAAYDDALKD